jgi:hypothetical protein
MSHRRSLRPLLALAVGIFVLPALAASSFAKDAAPGKSIRVAVLPFVNASPEIGATKMMDDIVREQVKKVDKSRAVFLLPADVERILTDRNQLGLIYRITDKWGATSALDSTGIGGLDSLLQVDVVLLVKISEWESHRVPVVGAGQSSSTVALSMAAFDIRTKSRIWSKNPREQRFAAELDASSANVNYDETGFIQRKSDSAPPRIEAVAGDLIRDALKTFPNK